MSSVGSCSGCGGTSESVAAVGLLIAAKQLQAIKQQGAAMGQLLEDAVRLSRAADRGQNLDLTA